MASWSVLTAATASRATTWSTLTSTASGRSTTWAVAGQLTSSRPTTWAAAESILVTRFTAWAVLADLTSARTTTWAVLPAGTTDIDVAVGQVFTGWDAVLVQDAWRAGLRVGGWAADVELAEREAHLAPVWAAGPPTV